MKGFQPARQDISVLNLDRSISDYYNKNKKLFFETLQTLPPQKLIGMRDRKLEKELKDEIKIFLNIKDSVQNENIIFGFGSYSILERLAWKILPKGLMIGESPQFPYFPMEYLLAGGKYKALSEKNFTFSKNAFLKKITNQKNLKVIYINNPNNPTGQTYNKEDLIEIIVSAEKKNVYVIIDEVYGDLLPAPYSLAGYVNNYSNLIVVRSFSKAFGLQNIRLGYMIANKKIIIKYKNLCNWNEITNMNAFLGIMILKDKKYLQNLRNTCKKNKKYLCNILEKKNFYIAPTNLLVPILFIQPKNKKCVKDYIRKKNINFGYCDLYNQLDPSIPREFIRIRVPQDKQIIDEFNKRLCDL